MKNPAIVVLSGGQDSVTCLYWAKSCFDEVHAITFDYGQRHAVEVGRARLIARMAGISSHETVSVPDILHSRSPLTDKTAELEKYANFVEMDWIIGNRRELTFVPMRNALFLTIAANRAEMLGVRTIVTGVCAMDNANYSDCRPQFINAMQYMINMSNGADEGKSPGIGISTPLIYRTKAESIEMAFNLPGCWEGLAHSHTCYDGQTPPCGKCHSCVLRAEGFRMAGLPDPMILRYFDEGLISLPNTTNYSLTSLEKGQLYAK